MHRIHHFFSSLLLIGPFGLVLDLRPRLNELAPVKHQVRSFSPGEYTLSNPFSALYGIVHQQYDAIERNLETCLGEITNSRRISAVSRNAVRVVNIPGIFGTVLGLLNEYVLHRRHGTKLIHSPGI